MADQGQLEKMLILAFADSKKAENGGVSEAVDIFEALINPETYTVEYKFKYADSDQGQGASAKQLKYERTEPQEMTFEFLFDGTGIIDGEKRRKNGDPPLKEGEIEGEQVITVQDSIINRIQKFKQVLIDYKGDSHEPRHLKLVWGKNSIFKGRTSEISINYKLFKPDGTPIRAVAKIKVISSIEETKRALQEDKQSADLTHIREVKAGDTLPLMCQHIYGDSRYYLQVARENKLDNFRLLQPGAVLRFPPVDTFRTQL
ncbi:MAG: LysM peptidoglycan-binding domain-containing protein [Candidatus Electrothrix sp. LOE1_4_5]|nr:LysM peptidoglycan-binding domain-containing protein [Candidatus Electrothrix gigas]